MVVHVPRVCLEFAFAVAEAGPAAQVGPELGVAAVGPAVSVGPELGVAEVGPVVSVAPEPGVAEVASAESLEAAPAGSQGGRSLPRAERSTDR